MQLRHRIEIETFILLFLTACISGFFVWYSNKSPLQKASVTIPIIQNNNESIVPTAVPTPEVDEASQISPDGKETLKMKVTHNLDQTLTYLFTASDSDGSNERQIYATSSADLTFSIPFNTWSPDDKYVFIEKGSTNALVFNASGNPITSDQTYLEVRNDFQTKLPNVTIREITGWAGYGLLIVNSTASDGTQGSSYWYEVPSGGIEQLSTKF